MANYIIRNDELYHYGVKGMKWGVRRFQNPDGSLTDAGKKRLAKGLAKQYKRDYDPNQPFKTSKEYDESVRDLINHTVSKDDVKRIRQSLDTYRSMQKEVDRAGEELDKLAVKYANEEYDRELRRAPGEYSTEKSKARLYEYCVYDHGYSEARKARPDLDKVTKQSDKAWESYRNECKKVADKILGEYGSAKVYESKHYSRTVRDTVADGLSSIGYEKLK